MGMTFDALKNLLDTEQLNYFIHPKSPAAMFKINGKNGSLGFVVSLEMDGDFLRIASTDYTKCPPDSPHLPALFRLLSDLSRSIRWVKWSWDPRDGEIWVTGDMWVMDSQITQKQFRRMLENIIPSADEQLSRFNQVIQTGQDSGEDPPPPPETKTVDSL